MKRDPNPTDVESLIRDHLDRQEQAVDPARILAKVRARQAAGGQIGSSRFWASRAGRGARRAALGGLAAALILGFAWTFHQANARAEAVELVQAARAALGASPSDRAYRIAIHLAPGMAERSPYLAALGGFDCRLWTRSDRLWIEGRQGSAIWATGRDEQRHVWVAPDAEVGIDFRPGEIPGPLDEAIDLFQFDLGALLQLLATEFVVTPDPAAGPDDPATRSGLTRLRGVPRPEHPRPRLGSITVAIDERTKLVHQVVLARLRGGQPLAEVAFTFEQAGHQPDSAYGLAAHLAPGAPVLGPDQRLLRRRALARFFGSLLLKGE